MATVIDRDQVQEIVQRGALLVEVLSASEYAEDHLPGAINIPLRDVNRETAATLDRERPVIVYCWDMA